MKWKVATDDCKMCLQLAAEHSSHFLVPQIDHVCSPPVNIRSGRGFHDRHRSSTHFYRVDAQLLKDDFKPRPPTGLSSVLGCRLEAWIDARRHPGGTAHGHLQRADRPPLCRCVRWVSSPFSFGLPVEESPLKDDRCGSSRLAVLQRRHAPRSFPNG